MSAGHMCECARVSSVCICTHTCMSTVCVTHGMPRAPWDSDGKDAGVSEAAWEERSLQCKVLFFSFAALSPVSNMHGDCRNPKDR